jgi:hypothetical protein
VKVDAEPAAVDLAGAQRHQPLGGLGQRGLLDRQADVVDPLGDAGAERVVHQDHARFHAP